jgi:hypothetical protein
MLFSQNPQRIFSAYFPVTSKRHVYGYSEEIPETLERILKVSLKSRKVSSPAISAGRHGEHADSAIRATSYGAGIMMAVRALEMPLPSLCCRRPAGCTSASGEPSSDRKTTARIVRRRNDESSQSRHGRAVPPPTQQQAPDTVQPSSGRTPARSED